MSRYTDPPLAKSSRRSPSERKGHQIYFYLQEVLGVTLLVAVLLVVARSQGWADTANDPAMARMLRDDGAVWRAGVMIVLLVAALFVVGKPQDKNPTFTVLWRVFGVFMCIAAVALFAWFGWGWRP